MDIFGVPFDSPFGSGQLVIHPKTSIFVSLLVFAMSVIICFLSALPPASKASTVEPVKAFRGQIS